MMRFLYHLIDKNIKISVSCNLISPVNVFDYVIADSTELLSPVSDVSKCDLYLFT